jgi:hypothetical protein
MAKPTLLRTEQRFLFSGQQLIPAAMPPDERKGCALPKRLEMITGPNGGNADDRAAEASYKDSWNLINDETMSNKLISVTAFLLFFFCVGLSQTSSSPSAVGEHTVWVERTIAEIETIKVGMTRADLMKVFEEEGGLSTRTYRKYVYHDCPLIKVIVEFQPVGKPGKLRESPKDKIIKISKPFLERVIVD